MRSSSPRYGPHLGEILDRLGLRIDGSLTQAAQVLYGKRFLPEYPQCLLKMGRFRGTKITGEIVDNRQEHMNAFAMVREGMEFLRKTMPLGARFPKGQIFREDRFPVPLEAPDMSARMRRPKRPKRPKSRPKRPKLIWPSGS